MNARSFLSDTDTINTLDEVNCIKAFVDSGGYQVHPIHSEKMERKTRAEIDEIKLRGFEAETIRRAEFSEQQTLKADALIERVRAAFAGVVLDSGVGLFEGQALDDYESDEVCAQVRKDDEKDSWERIKSEDLRTCSSSLCFFDALGMKFHLPAFIISELKDDYGMGMEFTLTSLCDYRRDQFRLLTTQQRCVVREFLLLLRDDPESVHYHAEIDSALNDYWKEQ